MPLFGPPNIEKLKAKRNIKNLIKALDYADSPQIQRDAALALCEIADPITVPLLMNFLSHSDPAVRASAADALGRLRASQAISALEPLIEDPDEGVRGKAIFSLARLGHSRAEDLLLSALQDDSQANRLQAIQTLHALRSSKAIKPLVALLEEENEDIVTASGRALYVMDEKLTLGELGVVMEKGSQRQRLHAIDVIGSFRKSEEAMDKLIQALKTDEDELVRKAAARKMGIIGGQKAIDALGDVSRTDPSEAVRELASDQCKGLLWEQMSDMLKSGNL